MKRELAYRTYEQLLDSVKGDMKKFDIEGYIGNQEMIKVVQKINRDLGLKINPSVSKMLEVYGRKAKLPSDFHAANFALLCGQETTYDNYNFNPYLKTYDLGVLEGKRLIQDLLNTRVVKQYTEIRDIVPGPNKITHRLDTRYVVVQTFSPSGLMLSFNINILNDTELNIISESDETITNVKVVVMGARASDGPLCDPEDPYSDCPEQPILDQIVAPDSTPQLSCTPTGCGTVAYQDNNKLKKYHNLTILNFVDSKSNSLEEISLNSARRKDISIKNGFLTSNFDEGHIFLNYQSTMENAEGELIVLYDPLVDDYYEYAIKKRVIENMLADGENVSHLYQMYSDELRAARITALNFVNTPNFATLKRAVHTQRKAMHYKYFNMFK